MEKVLLINACVRENSRTLALAKYVLDRWGTAYTEVNLQESSLQPLDRESLARRERLITAGDFSNEMFRFAREFAAARTIVIAAPYWDLAFPALLKIYFEQITVSGITFAYEKGVPHSLCKVEKLLYITTAGGYIDHNFGFDYVKTMAETFFAIPYVSCLKAEGLDIKGANVREIMAQAMRRAEEESSIVS